MVPEHMHNTAIQNAWWIYTGKIRHLLYCCFFFFMPFTQALTFKIGFPLKFSEMALIMLSTMFVIFDKKVQLPRSVTVLISALTLAITVSFVVNLFSTYPYLLKDYDTRFGYKGDSLARYIYYLLAVLAFLISVQIFLTDTNRYIRVWIYGALTAAIYTWYLSIFSALHLPYYLLPGMENPPQMIGNNIIRCGTFPEGNSMGLFFLASAALSLYIKRYKEALFLFASVLPTFSTLTVLSLFVFLCIYLKKYIFKRPSVIIACLLILIPTLYFATKTQAYRLYVHNKLFGATMTVTNEGSYSRVDRLISLKSAYNMGKDNPVWGVGLSNYARHYAHYLKGLGLTTSTVETFTRAGVKTIPNNIYGEIWGESGAIAFFLFIVLLIQLLFYARTEKDNILTGMLIVMCICFNAYPSFIMIYLWCCMALPVAHFVKSQQKNPPRNVPA